MSNLPLGAEYEPQAPYNEVEVSICLYCGDVTEDDADFCNQTCRYFYENDEDN